jgi:phosphatidylethanolamine N-methyltransferase
MLLLIITYALLLALLPPLSPSGLLTLHFTHALLWCLFHTFGLGWVLRKQGRNKFLVRHFLKNYHYPQEGGGVGGGGGRDAGRGGGGGGGAVVEAFNNWKGVYNLSMCMTYSMSFPLSFVLCGGGLMG